VDINITIFHIPVNKKTSAISISINKPASLFAPKVSTTDTQPKKQLFEVLR
jgi:hypothetical protein